MEETPHSEHLNMLGSAVYIWNQQFSSQDKHTKVHNLQEYRTKVAPYSTNVEHEQQLPETPISSRKYWTTTKKVTNNIESTVINK